MADGAIKIVTDIQIDGAKQKIRNLIKEMSTVSKASEKLKRDMDEIANMRIETKDYILLKDALAKVEEELDSLRINLKHGLIPEDEIEAANERVKELESHVVNLKNNMKKLEDAGEAFTPGYDTEQYHELEKQLETLTAYQKELQTELGKSEKFLSFTKNLASITSELKEATKAMGKFIASTASKIVKPFTEIKKHSNSSGNAIEKFGHRILGLAKRVFVFGLITKGFRGMLNGINEGFQNYIAYDNILKQSIVSLKESLNEFKANLGSAFEPIATAILPYLKQFVSYLNEATIAVNQFISTMLGRTSFKKALSGIGSVKDSADKTAKGLNDASDAAKKLNKELGKYDELNVISQNTNTTSSGGKTDKTEGLGIGYEDVPISQQISDFAERIKEAWRNADFTEIGQIFGEKINQALEMIDWTRIQEVANKIAKSIATFLNGAIKTIDWPLVGQTITNGINTAFQFVNTFATNFDFKNLGTAISDTINAGLSNLDWNTIKSSAYNIFLGVATMLNTSIGRIDWGLIGSTLGNSINTIINAVYAFVTNLDFRQIGSSFSKFFNNAVHTIEWRKIGEIIGSGLQAAMDFVTTFIAGLKWGELKNALVDFLKGVMQKVDGREVMLVLFTALGSSITLALVKTALAGVFAKLVGFIGTAIIGFITTSALAPVAIALFTVLGAAVLAHWDSSKSIGENIVNGIKEGIWEPIKKIGSWIKNIVDWIINGFKDKFGIHSPARTMIPIGENVGLGLLEGIKGVFKSIGGWLKTHVLDKILNGIKNAKEFFSEAGEKLWGGIKSAYNGVKKTLTATVTMVKDKAFETVKSVWDGIKDKTATVTTTIKEAASSAWNTIKSWFGGGNSQSNNVESTATLTVQPKLPAGWMGIAKFVGDYVEVNLKISLPFGFSLEKTVGNKVKVSIQLTKKGWTNIAKFVGENVSVKIGLEKKGWQTIAKFVGDALTVNISLAKKGWQTIEKYIGNSVTVGVSLSRKGWQSIDKFVGTSVNVFISLSKSGWRTIQDFVGSSVEVSVYLRQVGQSLTSMIPSWVDVPVYFQARNSIQNLLPSWVEIPVYFKAMNSVSATRREDGGVYSFGSWRDIPQFASGGIPNHGSLAFIGENGPEILGHVNGRTEVLNKSQIASAIYQAVLSAMSQAMSGIANGVISQMINDTRAVLEIGGDMLKAVQNPVKIPVGTYNYMPANIGSTVPSMASINGYSGGNQQIDVNAIADALAQRINIPVNFTGSVDGRPLFDTVVNINRQQIEATGRNPMGGGKYGYGF